MASKVYLTSNVLEEAEKRVGYVFDSFKRIYISFSAGKDSSVLFHIAAKEARKRGIKIGVLFIDWECQFQLTIDHAKEMFIEYSDCIDIFWIQLEISTNNASSMFEPMWTSWDEEKKNLWTRGKDEMSIKHKSELPFYFKGITFEEFVPLFAKWYSNGLSTACLVGIRTDESLNRFRTILREKERFDGKRWTTNVIDNVWNCYPIYDFKTKDIWVFNYKTGHRYNKLYDRMHQAGLKISQMRVDEPFGDEARKNLWIYQIIEPDTWAKFVSRVSGVNSGALYCKDKGSILGQSVKLNSGQTYKGFCMSILDSMPPKTAEHYKNKIAKYLKWYEDRGYPEGIPDESDYKMEQLGKAPSWRVIAKVLLRNDYWCKGLGFSITKSSNYEKYMKLMQRKRNEWNILN